MNRGRPLFQIIVSLGCILGLWETKVQGAVYQYFPSSPLHLSGGFDPVNPFELMLPCINYDSIKNVDTTGATKTRFTLSLIKSRQDLYHDLQVSSSLSANYLFFSAGGGFDLEDQSAFHADSLTWIVLAGSDYGRFILENARLNPEAQRMVDNFEYDSFAKRCGSEVVLEERRGALI